MRCLVSWLVFAWLAPASVSAQTLGLTGRWERVDPVTLAAADDAAPAWEVLTIDTASLALQRSAQATRTETYVIDDVERAVTRAPGQMRTCRARWNGTALELACHQTDGGPGGNTPPIDTLEVRQLDADGQLLVDLTWTSGTTTVRRHAVYRRAQ